MWLPTNVRGLLFTHPRETMSQSLLDQIKGQIGAQALQQLASQVGITEDKAKSAVDASIPALLTGLASNAMSKDGAASLLNALKDHAGNPNLSNLAAMLSSDAVAKDGKNILSHILGSQEAVVKEKISAAAGIQADQAGNVLAQLAPIVMGFLGNKVKSEGGLNLGTLMSLLQSEGGIAQGALGGLLGNVLGGNKAGGIDTADLAQKGLSTLVGLFGKK